MKTLLSIIVPVFNEKKTIEKIINQILKVKYINKQIVIVDDCSTDGTRNILKYKIQKKVDKILYHKKNLGKGAAIQTAQRYLTGVYTIIQDADLEYNPKDYQKMIKKMRFEKLNILYGSRVLGKKRYSSKHFTSKLRIFFNHLLTEVTNFLYHQNLTDAHTCYKLFKTDFFKKIKLIENGFAFCPEITAKFSKLGYKIVEIPISYKGRTYKEGKKISYTDGIRALFVLIKYKIFN